MRTRQEEEMKRDGIRTRREENIREKQRGEDFTLISLDVKDDAAQRTYSVFARLQ